MKKKTEIERLILRAERLRKRKREIDTELHVISAKIQELRFKQLKPTTI